MDVKIIATKECAHRPNLEHELQQLGVEYELIFVEDAPDVVKQFNIRHSPNLVLDDEVVFRSQPSEEELKTALGLTK